MVRSHHHCLKLLANWVVMNSGIWTYIFIRENSVLICYILSKRWCSFPGEYWEVHLLLLYNLLYYRKCYLSKFYWGELHVSGRFLVSEEMIVSKAVVKFSTLISTLRLYTTPTVIMQLGVFKSAKIVSIPLRRKFELAFSLLECNF